MAEAAYAAGTTLLGGPRLLSSIISEFFVPCFGVGLKQCASAGPQGAQVPRKREAPNKIENVSVGSKQRGAPKSPRPPKTKLQNKNVPLDKGLQKARPKKSLGL